MSEPQSEEIRRINLKVPDGVHQRLRMVAVRQRTTLQDLLSEWINQKLGEAEKARREGAE